MTARPMAPLSIVMVGETISASRTPQRLEAMRALGHRVAMVSTTLPGSSYEDRPTLATRLRSRLRLPADPAGANAALLEAAGPGTDVVWLDNAKMIRLGTLARLRRQAPGVRVIWYCEDDMMNPRHRTRWTEALMPAIDLWVTTKSRNLAPMELPSLGVRRMLFTHNAFDPAIHRPLELDPEERARLGADISFVGTFEEPRAASMLALADAGLAVRVWGNGWTRWIGRHPLMTVEGRPCYGYEYAKVVSASRINLCFLRKFNRDLQTCRSVEIPAIGGFMAHERNDEIMALFADGVEAVGFDDDAELVALCRRWLADDDGRAQVARRGRERVLAAGLTHRGLAERALKALLDVGI